jgi:hypothetical protein
MQLAIQPKLFGQQCSVSNPAAIARPAAGQAGFPAGVSLILCRIIFF